MSKKELAELQKDYEYLMSQEGGFEVICQNYDIHKEYLDKLELQAFDKINESLKKEFEWIKWIVAIAAGVFSVMTTQLAKGNFQGEQLLLIKFAIISNAIGVIFGVLAIDFLSLLVVVFRTQQVVRNTRIVVAEQQHRLGRFSISTGSADFLVIGLG